MPPQTPPAPAQTAPVCRETDSFAVQVFSQLAANAPGNIVFSPAGVENVLHLLRQGARGKTAQELDALPMGQLGIKSTLQPLEANALFIADDFPLKKGIQADDIQKVPFAEAPDKACQTINGWASKNTKGLIKQILNPEDISADTRLIAANAIYLKENWLHAFPEHSTRKNADFTLADGTKTKVPMMHVTEQFRYAETDDWQAVAIDYNPEGRKGHQGYFIAVLPKGDARTFAQNLTPQSYNEIRCQLRQSRKEKVILGVPRFENAPGVMDLTSILQNSGLSLSFSHRADFSGFADELLYLDRVLQRCYVKVNEEGTEAAAVTVATTRSFSMRPSKQPKQLILNRPFFWVITDLESAAAPYFMGLFEKP